MSLPIGMSPASVCRRTAAPDWPNTEPGVRSARRNGGGGDRHVVDDWFVVHL